MKVAVIGASGYVGAELISLLCAHDKISLEYLLVSENSSSADMTFSQLHPRYLGVCDLPFLTFPICLDSAGAPFSSSFR